MSSHQYHGDEPRPHASEGPSLPGDPRCYFCGSRFRREEDVAKTKYSVGNGYSIFVMICRECRGKKERGEPPFTKKSGCAGALLAVAAAALLLW